jgi:hypothetical protein
MRAVLLHSPEPEDVSAWQQTFAAYRSRLRPNRISGAELYEYLVSRYPFLPLKDERADRVVRGNILKNKCFADELPKGGQPTHVCGVIAREGTGMELYRTQDGVFSGCDIFVGIDLVTGYFTVEGSSLLWDELYARRGLNERDLTNPYCVAEYVSCLKRFGSLEQTLDAMNE